MENPEKVAKTNATPEAEKPEKEDVPSPEEDLRQSVAALVKDSEERKAVLTEISERLDGLTKEFADVKKEYITSGLGAIPGANIPKEVLEKPDKHIVDSVLEMLGKEG